MASRKSSQKAYFGLDWIISLILAIIPFTNVIFGIVTIVAFEFLLKFISEFSREIYNDYDKLNHEIIDRYGVEIPENVKDTVNFADGKTKIIPIEELFEFIDSFKDETNIF